MKIKKIPLVIQLLLLTFSGVCGATDLKVVGTQFLPLDGTGKDGKAQGAYVEILEHVCKKLNHNCTFEIFPAKRAESMIVDGEAHIVMGFTKSSDREKTMRFSDAISKSGYTFFVKKGTAGQYKSANDFFDKEIGVYSGGTFTSFAKVNQTVGGKLKYVKEVDTALPLKKLNGGRYPAAFSNRNVGNIAAKDGNFDVEPVSFDPDEVDNFISFSRKSVSDDLYNKMSAALDEFIRSPEGKAIFKKWDLKPASI